MARKELPYQADFNAEDKARIVRWMIDQHGAADRWGRPLLTLEWWKGRSTRRLLFTVPDFRGNPVTLAANVGAKVLPIDVRKAFRVLGFPGADTYIVGHREMIDRNRPVRTEDQVFENLWLNLSHAGAGANLEKILTADRVDAIRWKAALKESGKTWADVRLSSKAAAEIADMILGEMLGAEYRRGAESLRVRFRRYARRLREAAPHESPFSAEELRALEKRWAEAREKSALP